MGRKGKWEYFRAIYGRYHKTDRQAKQVMLNDFCLTTGYHRKYAIRILNGPPPGKRPARSARVAVPFERMGGGPGIPGRCGWTVDWPQEWPKP